MISSSNSDFNADGFAALVRDMERAYLLLSELGVEGGDSTVSTTIRFDGGGQFPASNYWIEPSEGPYNTLTVNNVVLGGNTANGLAGADGVNGVSGGFPPDSISGDGSFINVDNSVFTITPGDNVFVTDGSGTRINTGQEAGVGVGTKLKVTAVIPPYIFPDPLTYTWTVSPVTRTIGFGSGADISTDTSNNTGGIWCKRIYGNHNVTTSMSNTYNNAGFGTNIYTIGNVGATGNTTYDTGFINYLRSDNGIYSRTIVPSSGLGSWSETVYSSYSLDSRGVSGESIPSSSSNLTGNSSWAYINKYSWTDYRISNTSNMIVRNIFGTNPFIPPTSSSVNYYLVLDALGLNVDSYSTVNIPNLFFAQTQKVSGTRSGTLHIFPSSMSTDGKIQMTGYSIDLADSTGTYKVNGTQVVTTRQSAITAPSGGTTIDTQARTAINTIISRLQTHGLIA